MNKIYAKTKEQVNQNTSPYYAKIFTAYKSFYNTTLYHLNGMKFTVYQPCCYKMNSKDCGYIEKNYWFALFKKDDGSFYVSLYDLDDKNAGNLECAYIDNGNSVDVYVTGGRQGVPVYLTVQNTPLISRFYFHNNSLWTDMSNNTKLVKAEKIVKNYTITPNFNGITQWQLDTDYFNDAYITREEVHLNFHIKYKSNTGWGNGTPIMKLPFYDSYEGKGAIKFSATFEYKKKDKLIQTGVCKISFNSNGFYVGGEDFPATGLSAGDSLTIHLVTHYRRVK